MTRSFGKTAFGKTAFGKTALWAALAGLGYLGFSVWAGWSDVSRAMAQVGPIGLCVALGLSLANWSLRFLRWQIYLRALGADVPNGQSALIYFSGFAFTATPGRAGELLRGVFLQKHGMSFMKATAAFVSERVSDLLALLLIALPGFALFAPKTAALTIALGALGAMCLALAFLAGAPRRIGRRAADGSRAKRMLNHALALWREWTMCNWPPGLFARTTALSLAAWTLESLSFAYVLHLLGLGVTLPNAIFIYAAALVAGALSLLPGGLGGTEATMLGLLAASGVSQPDAVAATLLLRLTTLWFAVAFGAVLALSGRRKLLAPVRA